MKPAKYQPIVVPGNHDVNTFFDTGELAAAPPERSPLVLTESVVATTLASDNQADPFKKSSPPQVAQFALLLIPKRNREHLIGDMEEEYRTIALPKYGRFLACAWYWEQTAIAVGRYLLPVIKRILGFAVIWKLIGK